MARLSCFAGRANTYAVYTARTACDRLRVGKVVVSGRRWRWRRRWRRSAVCQIVAERSERERIVAGDGSTTTGRDCRVHDAYVAARAASAKMFPVA